MESMDYNYFAQTANQPFQFMGFGADNSFPGVNGDAGAHPPNMDPALDSNAFMPNTFDYAQFDASLGPNSGLTPLPATSVSPPAQPLSMTPNNSMDPSYSPDADEQAQRRRSSSEEKESLTPAQSRRKAQNRAAQRAFRERKERHVRDLEAKLNLLTTTTSSLQSDNERLKLMLQRAQTENEILRASASSSSSSPPNNASSSTSLSDDHPNLLSTSRGKATSLSLSSDRRSSSAAGGFTSNARSAFAASSSPGKTASSPASDSHLLSASATWDLLQSHPLYLSGAVDIGEVCERLKKMAKCDGMGPMFEEEEVRKVIEEVGRSGGDELI